MKREERYIVLKDTDIKNTDLTAAEQVHLVNICDKVAKARIAKGKIPLRCVVVESDWPEFEPVWKMIEDRMDKADVEQWKKRAKEAEDTAAKLALELAESKEGLKKCGTIIAQKDMKVEELYIQLRAADAADKAVKSSQKEKLESLAAQLVQMMHKDQVDRVINDATIERLNAERDLQAEISRASYLNAIGRLTDREGKILGEFLAKYGTRNSRTLIKSMAIKEIENETKKISRING